MKGIISKLWILFILFSLVVFPFLNCQEAEEDEGQISLIEPINIQDAGDTPILIDGIFSPGEWEDAVSFRVDQRVNLLIKTKKGHLFIGIKCNDLKIPVADIYISSEQGPIYQLHASAQLGERILSNKSGRENDPSYNWGETKDWYANEVRWNNRELESIIESEGITRDEAFSRVVYPYEGFEFQIKYSKFHTNELWIMLDISYEDTDRKSIIIPTNTERKHIDNWIKLILK